MAAMTDGQKAKAKQTREMRKVPNVIAKTIITNLGSSCEWPSLSDLITRRIRIVKRWLARQDGPCLELQVRNHQRLSSIKIDSIRVQIVYDLRLRHKDAAEFGYHFQEILLADPNAFDKINALLVDLVTSKSKAKSSG